MHPRKAAVFAIPTARLGGEQHRAPRVAARGSGAGPGVWWNIKEAAAELALTARESSSLLGRVRTALRLPREKRRAAPRLPCRRRKEPSPCRSGKHGERFPLGASRGAAPHGAPGPAGHIYSATFSSSRRCCWVQGWHRCNDKPPAQSWAWVPSHHPGTGPRQGAGGNVPGGRIWMLFAERS